MKKMIMLLFLVFTSLFVSGCNTMNDNEEHYTVMFLNYDNTLLYSDTDVKKGEPAIYAGITPTRPETNEYTYNFIGWDKDISAIYSDLVVFAEYETINKGEINNDQEINKPDVDNYGKSMALNAYNTEKIDRDLELYNVGTFEDKYAVFYFNLGLIKRTPVYTSAALEYGKQDVNLELMFSMLTEESLENSISEVVEKIDTHSYTGGFNLGFEQEIQVGASIMGKGLKANFVTSQEVDQHWTNNWGETTTNSETTKTGYINSYTKSWKFNLEVSEEKGFKRGYSYRVSFYETIRSFGVLYYDYSTDEYTVAFQNMLLANQTRFVIEESNDTGEFNYNFDKTIDFDVDKAIEIAKKNMPSKDNSIKIKNKEEFKKYLNGDTVGKTFVLEMDTIDLRNEAWVPFNAFSGILEGNNCRILGWNYNQVSVGEIGLFKRNNGTIKNLVFEECNITNNNPDVNGTLNAGILCGSNYGKISNVNFIKCSINVDVGDADDDTSSYVNIGIICGYNEGEINGDIEINSCKLAAYAVTKLQDAQVRVGVAVGHSGKGYIDGITTSINDVYAYASGEWDKGIFGNCKAHGRPRIYYGNIVGLYANTIFGSNLSTSSNTIVPELRRGCNCDTNKGVIASDICNY